jgi:hypothetical protein
VCKIVALEAEEFDVLTGIREQATMKTKLNFDLQAHRYCQAG